MFAFSNEETTESYKRRTDEDDDDEKKESANLYDGKLSTDCSELLETRLYATEC